MDAEFYASTSSERQQLTSKQYELNAIIYSSNPDDKKVQALTKDVSDLRVKLYEAWVGFQKQMVKEGLPVMGDMGMMGGMGNKNCMMAGGMGF
ncbi:hypothetical protein [Fundidesulfovibrio putealis]|uniref:hypothetical protein n=1 Tax=Fundidesulfovibrio putealis TaxID=270496 RepID=UPI00040455F3|nr:hypothetical protein [Fundidesulfovibrio putealis]